MPTIRPRDTAPALAWSVLDLLVHGWGTPWPERPDNPDYWDVFDVGEKDLPGLYRAHRAAVEAEAHRRGLPQSWASTQFHGT